MKLPEASHPIVWMLLMLAGVQWALAVLGLGWIRGREVAGPAERWLMPLGVLGGVTLALGAMARAREALGPAWPALTAAGLLTWFVWYGAALARWRESRRRARATHLAHSHSGADGDASAAATPRLRVPWTALAGLLLIAWAGMLAGALSRGFIGRDPSLRLDPMMLTISCAAALACGALILTLALAGLVQARDDAGAVPAPGSAGTARVGEPEPERVSGRILARWLLLALGLRVSVILAVLHLGASASPLGPRYFWWSLWEHGRTLLLARWGVGLALPLLLALCLAFEAADARSDVNSPGYPPAPAADRAAEWLPLGVLLLLGELLGLGLLLSTWGLAL